MLLDKKSEFFLYLDLVKIRLEITLNNFVKEKKKPFFTRKHKLFKNPENRFSPMLMVKKCLCRFSKKLDLKKYLVTFHRKKDTFWTTKNRILQSWKKSPFF